MIGVFDSGLGGLSVWRSLKSALPGHTTLYLADQARAPYGSRPLNDVRACALDCLAWLIRQGCRTVVIACNTATAAAADAARARWPEIAIVGIEPAVKPAALASRGGIIGVLATQATFDSPRYAALVARHAAHIRVLRRACPLWVQLVEEGPRRRADADALVEAEVFPLLNAGADQLVLGCTHFPLLLPWIDAAVARWPGPHPSGGLVPVLDPAPAVARQVARVVRPGAVEVARDQFWTTGDAARFSIMAAESLGDEWRQGESHALPLNALGSSDRSHVG